MSVTYRDAGPADADAVAAIGRDTFVETFGHLYRAEDLQAFIAGDHAPAPVAALLAKPGVACRLAQDGEGVAGYAVIAPNALPHVDPARPTVELKRLYLRPRLHGTGAADALMAWALDRARADGADAMSLSVFADNARAKRFYARHGFTERGSYVFMVGDQADDERVMVRAL